MNVTYLLPIRRTVFLDNETAELREYLSILLALGWLRGNARHYFPFYVCLFALLWSSSRE